MVLIIYLPVCVLRAFGWLSKWMESTGACQGLHETFLLGIPKLERDVACLYVLGEGLGDGGLHTAKVHHFSTTLSGRAVPGTVGKAVNNLAASSRGKPRREVEPEST